MVTNFDSDLDLNKPELRIEVNRDKAADLGIPLETIGKTLEGMEYLVIVQTQAQHRGTRSDSKQLQVRGTQGT